MVAIIITLTVLCLTLCGLLALAYLERREMRDDYRKIVNEFSIRTNGRLVYKDAKPAQSDSEVPASDRGEFKIMTPMMAERAMEQAESSNGEMTEEDLEFLRSKGVPV